jgi:hypothetical protein
MPDHYEANSNTSSLVNQAVGAVLAPFIGMFLIWFGSTQAFDTEGHAVRVEKALTVGSRIVQQLSDANASKLQDHLAYVSGDAKVSGDVRDPATGVTAPVLRLVRHVEMYQWEEESHTSGGRHSTHRTYDYYKTWRDSRIDSTSFHYHSGHENPQFPILSQGFEAQCTVDGHSVPGELLKKVPAAVPLRPIPSSLNLYNLTHLMQMPCSRSNGEIYVGSNPSAPAVGDCRISYTVTPVGALSLVAAEHANTFTPYVVSDGGEAVYLIEFGKVPVQKMFKDAQNDNQLHLWAARAGWLLVNWLGLMLLVYPIRAITSWIPILGDFAGFILGIVCGAGAFVINGIIIVSAWIYFRPMFALSVFGVIFVVAAWAMSMAKPREERVLR